MLGLVQGLTEFLPISSSAHLRIIGELIGSTDPGAAFTAITQIGTESAVLLYFRRDIARIVVAWWRAITGKRGTDWRSRMGEGDPDARMAWWIALGSVPIVVLGLAFQDTITTAFRNLYLIAATLLVFGLVLGWADRIGAKRDGLERLNGKHAVLLRLRPGDGADPRGVALRRHHHRGPADGLHPVGRRAVLVPAGHPRRARLGVRAARSPTSTCSGPRGCPACR